MTAYDKLMFNLGLWLGYETNYGEIKKQIDIANKKIDDLQDEKNKLEAEKSNLEYLNFEKNLAFKNEFSESLKALKDCVSINPVVEVGERAMYGDMVFCFLGKNFSMLSNDSTNRLFYEDKSLAKIELQANWFLNSKPTFDEKLFEKLLKVRNLIQSSDVLKSKAIARITEHVRTTVSLHLNRDLKEAQNEKDVLIETISKLENSNTKKNLEKLNNAKHLLEEINKKIKVLEQQLSNKLTEENILNYINEELHNLDMVLAMYDKFNDYAEIQKQSAKKVAGLNNKIASIKKESSTMVLAKNKLENEAKLEREKAVGVFETIQKDKDMLKILFDLKKEDTDSTIWMLVERIKKAYEPWVEEVINELLK